MTTDATTRLDEIRGRLAAATPGPWIADIDPARSEWDIWLGSERGGIVANVLRSRDGRRPVNHKANAVLIANAPADIEFLLGELDAIEKRLATDRASLREEYVGMSTADLVTTALDEMRGEIQKGWDYADVVERDGARDRQDRDAEIERLKDELDTANAQSDELFHDFALGHVGDGTEPPA